MKSMTFLADPSTITSVPILSTIVGANTADSNNNSNSNSNCTNQISSNGAMAGLNNRKTNEKYSLRQRQKRVCSSTVVNSTITKNAPASSLRSQQKTQSLHQQISEEDLPAALTRTGRASAKEKPKTKAAPLSKYRRKTANARERTRMREINSAFETLRRCVPQAVSGGATSGNQASQSPTNEKLTKITTLRLAMKYIRTLSEALSNPSGDTSFLYGQIATDKETCCSISSNNNNNNNHISNNNHLHHLLSSSSDSFQSVNATTDPTIKYPPPASTMVSSKNRASHVAKSLNSRSNTRFQKSKQQKLDYISLASSAMSSPTTSLDGNSPTTSIVSDLGLLLESDGESLHLSEPCLSPLGHHSLKPFGCAASALDSCSGALELGSLLLESDSESLQFSSEPCLSPLGTLVVDANFNPFGDLVLHSEFSEQTSLDMYLT